MDRSLHAMAAHKRLKDVAPVVFASIVCKNQVIEQVFKVVG